MILSPDPPPPVLSCAFGCQFEDRQALNTDTRQNQVGTSSPDYRGGARPPWLSPALPAPAQLPWVSPHGYPEGTQGGEPQGAARFSLTIRYSLSSSS